MKQVKVIKNVLVNGEVMEDEYTFTADCFPIAIEYAERWAKRSGYRLIKSPAKIAQVFAGCHRVAVSKDEKVFYVNNGVM